MRIKLLSALLLALLIAPSSHAADWAASGWCSAQSGSDGYCDAGVAASIVKVRHKPSGKRFAAVAFMGEETAGLGVAAIVSEEGSKTVLGFGVGVAAQYETDSGIDLDTASVVAGATLSFDFKGD